MEDDAPQDQAPDQHAHGERGGPGALPQGEDPRGLVRDRGGHAKAGEVLVRCNRWRSPGPGPRPAPAAASAASGAAAWGYRPRPRARGGGRSRWDSRSAFPRVSPARPGCGPLWSGAGPGAGRGLDVYADQTLLDAIWGRAGRGPNAPRPTPRGGRPRRHRTSDDPEAAVQPRFSALGSAGGASAGAHAVAPPSREGSRRRHGGSWRAPSEEAASERVEGSVRACPLRCRFLPASTRSARQALLAALDEGWADPARLYREGRRARHAAGRGARDRGRGGRLPARTSCPSPLRVPTRCTTGVAGALAGRHRTGRATDRLFRRTLGRAARGRGPRGGAAAR